MEEKLINFLKNKRVYSKFMRNIKDDTITEIVSRVENTDKPKIVTPIVAAFIWGLTPEGVQFWGRINREWIKENEVH